MLTVVVAGKAAPGATTSAVALALTWPRPVLLVDADPAGGDVVPGLLPGRATADRGLLSWAAAARRTSALEAVHEVHQHVLALPEAPLVWVMPGVATPAQGGAVAPMWPRVASALERIPTTADRDVIVDAGRLGEHSGWPLLGVADLVVLAVGTSARSVTAGVNAAGILRARLGDLRQVRVLVVDRGCYDPDEVAGLCRTPLLGVLPEDRRAAAALTDGGVVGLGGLSRSGLLRAASRIATRLAAPPADGDPGDGVPVEEEVGRG